MTNEQIVIKEFLAQYPEFECISSKLSINLYCDIMLEKDGKALIIAISDLPHDLIKVGYKLPTSWELKKKGRPTDAVKSHDIKVRVNDVTYAKLRAYGEAHNKTTAETVRDAIEAFLDEK